MLTEFSVKNFLSFKDKVTLSMEKGNGDENIDNTFHINNLDLLKTAAIYGANASGKSNLLQAFTCAILMIRTSNMIPLNGKWNLIKPFLFDETTKNEPSEFEFVFITNDIKYKYCFSADVNKIYNESLEAYYTQKATTIFSRTNTNEYKFFTADEAKLKSIETKNTENKLFLSTATTWNYDKTKDAFLWFLNSIDTYDSFDQVSNRDLIDYSNDEKSLKDFTLKLLRESDIFIKDIHVDYEERELGSRVAEAFISPLSRTQGVFKMKNVKIELDHEVMGENQKPHLYRLDFNDESSGTKILFVLAPYLKRAFDKPRVVIVDELEKSLHPTLVEYLAKIFNNKSINKVNSQLIFTTHATNLLNLDLLRRDQIWFTEKNPNNGLSDLYPLDSFSVRKDENIQKGYINGRYGAIPFIKDIEKYDSKNI